MQNAESNELKGCSELGRGGSILDSTHPKHFGRVGVLAKRVALAVTAVVASFSISHAADAQEQPTGESLEPLKPHSLEVPFPEVRPLRSSRIRGSVREEEPEVQLLRPSGASRRVRKPEPEMQLLRPSGASRRVREPAEEQPVMLLRSSGARRRSEPAEAEERTTSRIEELTPAEREDTAITRKIRALERQLHEEYGIRIAYGNNPSTTEYSAGKPTNQELIESELIKLSQLLTKYPPNVRARLRNITVYFAKDLRLKKNGQKAGGFAGDSYIVADIDNDIRWIFDHEYFHILDKSDGYEEDNETWARLNQNGMADYLHLNGTDALDADESATPSEGFSSTYGKEGGPDEDQAKSAQDLLNPWKAYTLTMRAKTDDILRNKLEAITGCLFDQVTGKFVRQLTLQEYKERLGFNDFQYYAAASRLPSGKLTMGPSYWNAIAASGEWHGVR